MAADEGNALDLVPVHRFVTANRVAEGEVARLVAWAQAQRRRRLPGVRGSPRLGEVVREPEVAGGVSEDCQRFRPVLLLDRKDLLGGVVECLFPGHLAELALATLTGSDHRRLEAIRVVHERHAALTSSAQHAAALRIVDVAVNLEDLAVDTLNGDTALPRTHVAVVIGGRHLARGEPGRIRIAHRER